MSRRAAAAGARHGARPRPTRPLSPKQAYSRAPDPKALVPLMESYLEDYNAGAAAPMRLVVFLDAVEHVSRLCR